MSKFRIIFVFAAISFFSPERSFALALPVENGYPGDCQNFRLDGRDVLPAVDPSEISHPETSTALHGKPLATKGGMIKVSNGELPSANLLQGQVSLPQTFADCFAITEYYVARMAIARRFPKQSCSFQTPDLFVLEDPTNYSGTGIDLKLSSNASQLIAGHTVGPVTPECRLASALSQYGLCSFQG